MEGGVWVKGANLVEIFQWSAVAAIVVVIDDDVAAVVAVVFVVVAVVLSLLMSLCGNSRSYRVVGFVDASKDLARK